LGAVAVVCRDSIAASERQRSNGDKEFRHLRFTKVAHLHFLCRDAPYRTVNIKLLPLSVPQFTGSYKNVCHKTQRRARCWLSIKAIDGAQECPDAFWVNDCCPVLNRRRSQ
jgi:hypothetical protein